MPKDNKIKKHDCHKNGIVEVLKPLVDGKFVACWRCKICGNTWIENQE